MRYFQSIPTVTQTDPYGNSITVNNITARAYFVPSLLNNIMMFYTYDLKDGDRAEDIAYKYYGDVYDYWLISYSNNYLDMNSAWPLDSNQFISYLNDKYSQIAGGNSNVIPYTTSTAYAYYQTITTYDTTSTQGQTIKVEIDQQTYNSLMPITQTAVLNGVTITKIIDKNIQSIYDYEVAQNEAKRNIKVMNGFYLTSVKEQFKTLMRK